MMEIDFKRLLTVAIILGFIAGLGIATINEYGGFSKLIHYWWYWTGYVFATAYIYFLSKIGE